MGPLSASTAAPSTIEITSCALGGHLLGRGTAVQNSLQEQFPDAEVENRYGCPLQFSISADGKQVLGGLSGTCTILKLLTCCTSPNAVAENAFGSEQSSSAWEGA